MGLANKRQKRYLNASILAIKHNLFAFSTIRASRGALAHISTKGSRNH